MIETRLVRSWTGALSTHSPGNADLALLIEGLKLILGAVDQYPQVFAVDPEFPADGIFLLIIQEDCAKKVAVAFRHGVKNAAHLLGRLLGNQHTLQVQYFVRNIHVCVLHRLVLGGGSVILQ